MSNVAKIAVPLLLVAAAAGGAYYFLNQGGETPIAPPGNEDVQTPDPVKPKQPDLKAQTGGKAKPIVRTEAANAPDNAHSNAPQGVKGRVLLPDGNPAVGVSVMLLENAMSNAIEMFIRNKTGRTSPPLATAVTVADGSFALGVLKPGESVDLRIVSDVHPEIAKSPIKVRSDDWYDAGDLSLEQGLVVQGRVVEATTKAPIANATVYMNTSNRAHAMAATPGRERGTAIVTDGGGFFRFDNGPRQGLINLNVEADGFASGNLLNQQVRADAANEFTLEIERGRTITGVVVDEAGERIRSVKIQAQGLSSKTPQSETVYSGDDGEFEFPALRSGPYRLTATTKSYADVEIPLALTDEDVKIVLAKRATVKLRVIGANNRPVKSYRLSLKRAFPNNPVGIGNVIDFPDRNINPGDYRGQWAIIEGLPSGNFKFQLTDRNHAKTLSPLFTVEEGGEAVEVTAALTMGGIITGTVIDDQGQPVRGALVASDMNAGLAANTGIFDIFRKMIPEKHTTRQVRTDGQGRFRITKLSFADYMLRVSHPTYCEGTAINIKLQKEGDVVDAGVIQLALGALVEGLTTVDGNPAGQVKVVISMPSDPNKNPIKPSTPEEMQAAARRLFSTKTLSDGDGRFSMLKRVPPGTYKITAARHSADNPFGALLDMRQSEQELVIAPGQKRIQINFNLSSR